MIMEVLTKSLYKIGDKVSESGTYLCVPCGYTQYFEADTKFTTCDACYAGTDLGPEGYKKSENEFWQLL